jgi:hypothetical protein
MDKGDKVKVKRGPMSGMTVELIRYDYSNRAWHCRVVAEGQPQENVFVYGYELAETIERKARKAVKRERV